MAKIAIVGGGPAGLSAGIYALKAGYDAEIIESHRLAGGNLTGWYRQGLYIDNCIHWLTGTNPNTREYGVWKELGVITPANGVVQPEKLYSYKSEEGTLSLYSDIDRTGAEMLQISPADEKRIFSFVDSVKKLMKVMGVGGENGSQKAGNFEVLLSAPKILAYHLKSVGDFAKKFDNRLIRRFFTCFMGEEFSSLALLFVFATFCGSNGGVLRCGSLGAAKAMSDEFLRLGEKLTLGKRAEEVYEEEGGACVRLEDGQIIKADYALLAADAKTIFGKLVNSAMPARLKRAYREMKTFSAF
ncbi:MAG: FAD-dependent oxidoreductase, partial [Clostridia bacterium]|nr:FAD-dependent oxidoreductase [Clostridia bacterium]